MKNKEYKSINGEGLGYQEKPVPAGWGSDVREAGSQ